MPKIVGVLVLVIMYGLLFETMVDVFKSFATHGATRRAVWAATTAFAVISIFFTITATLLFVA